MKKISKVQIQKFQEKVWDFYQLKGRHDLPWRPPQLRVQKGEINMYSVLVSEIMLQQTQVSRVLLKFKLWMKKFPDVQTLALASRKEVLDVWQGLGYTRRAKFLHELAITLKSIDKPKNVSELENLPGIGHYTARAIATFAWNQSYAFVETNIRTVYMHHFLRNQEVVTDKEIMYLVEQTLDTQKPREWMYALMDYGSFLKSQGVSYNARVKNVKKQAAFRGSVREVRGYIMKALTAKTLLKSTDVHHLENQFDASRTDKALQGLVKDGLIEKYKAGYRINEGTQ